MAPDPSSPQATNPIRNPDAGIPAPAFADGSTPVDDGPSPWPRRLLITVAGLTLGRLIGGTAIVEAIFNLPGMGDLIIESIGGKDYKVVQGAVLVVAVFFVLLNLLVDIGYAYLAPRIRRRG